MSTGYEPNIEGALAVLVDIMQGNGFVMTRSPYLPNYRGLVDALIDLKEGFPAFSPYRVGFNATAFEPVVDGDALYIRTSDGKVGKATASNGSSEAALVVGFAEGSAGYDTVVKVIVSGVIALPNPVDAGDIYFLSATTPGAITTTPPSTGGQAVTRVGEGINGNDFSIQLEPPVLLV